MAFIETPRFPVDLKYGSLGGPTQNTDIVRTGGGVEYRNANWSLPLFRYNAKYSVKTRTTALQIYDLFLAMQGRFGGFRVKDLWDYTSATNGVDAFARTDQTLGTGNGSETDFQLIKDYTAGSVTISRTIKKPVSSAGLLVEVDGLPKVVTTDYTIDYTTGIITFNNPVPNGDIVKAGFEFDVPCRFDTDDLSDLFFTLAASAGSDTDIVNYSDIPLIEVRT